jgi:REP element-mobilizing transposase RayT
VHVVLRVIGAVGNLRRRFTYRAIREATLTTARREDFRIVHVSIQRTHVHLLVEADHKDALASGMQGFQISAAKHLNAEISRGKPGPRRRGTVFPVKRSADRVAARDFLAPGPYIGRLTREQLAQAPGGSRAADEHVAHRLVLERRDVPGLGGVRRRGVPVAGAADLRSADRVRAANMAPAGGLEEIRIDLVPRGAGGEAVSCTDALLDE